MNQTQYKKTETGSKMYRENAKFIPAWQLLFLFPDCVKRAMFVVLGISIVAQGMSCHSAICFGQNKLDMSQEHCYRIPKASSMRALHNLGFAECHHQWSRNFVQELHILLLPFVKKGKRSRRTEVAGYFKDSEETCSFTRRPAGRFELSTPGLTWPLW